VKNSQTSHRNPGGETIHELAWSKPDNQTRIKEEIGDTLGKSTGGTLAPRLWPQRSRVNTTIKGQVQLFGGERGGA